MIRGERFKAGQSLPAERQLAVEFEVSRGIVRSALKNLSDQGLLESKPNCRPVVRASKRVDTSTRRHVAIWLWPTTSDFAASSILKGIQGAGLDGDTRLLIGSAPFGDWEATFEAEKNFLDSLADDPVEAGAIVWYLGADRNRPSLERLRRANVPLIFIDRQPPAGFSADFVGTNNENAARLAVEHLIGLGHRRIGLITNVEGVSTVAERETGYLRALRNFGLSADPDLVQRDSVDEPIGIETILDHYLSLKEPPTAVFCINDHLALQLHDITGRRGIKVPQELSIVGFDGLLRWVPGGGYLTTAEQDFYRMGQLAAELVIERMTYGRPEAYKHVLLDAPLADHGSTASPQSLPTRSFFK